MPVAVRDSVVDSLVEWIALSFVIGVGSRTAAQLIDRFGSPAACFRASTYALESAGLSRQTIVVMKSSEPLEKAHRELDLLRGFDAQAIVLRDERYPPLLRETYDPPIVIYARGDLKRAVSQPSVAVVGSRLCSTYGRNVAERLSRDLAERGVTIVSGLARGIDSCAHRAALEVQGLTIGVMGTGLNDCYPRENRKLAERIASTGALVTEFPLGSPPVSQNFPFRNRVISGLSLGVLVVEGAERSGSLITARLAHEQGRDVYAVPGNITSAKSFGPNYLIKDGAKLVQVWRDIVDEFPIELKEPILSSELSGSTIAPPADDSGLSPTEKRILGLLKPDEAVHVDQLLAQTGIGLGELLSVLLSLEIMGRVRQLPGKAYVRKL
ncbi:MAG TPA: DNA-processing protein DprA [Blastocatellia bacterium]|nr:DNA-processing protein DprA [Blastocatellia bacterium]